jgi:hypothetical protein
MNFEFDLKNTTYGKLDQECPLYRKRAEGDVNTLVLTLMFVSDTPSPATLSGGTMPGSNRDVPEPGPTTLFLTFGSKDFSDKLSLDALVVEASADGGATWKPVPKSGDTIEKADPDWCFKHFPPHSSGFPPYVGLCPTKDVPLGKAASVKFRFTQLTCTYEGLDVPRLQIDCYNLPGDTDQAGFNFHVIDPPGYLNRLEDFTPRMTGRTLPHAWDPDNAHVAITSEALSTAFGDRLVNELKLTLSARSLDLSGTSSFTLSFVSGSKDDTGALTSLEDIENIKYVVPAHWSVTKQAGKVGSAPSWLIERENKQETFILSQPVEFVFNNIKIANRFSEGLTYAYLTSKNVKGYRDDVFPLPASRISAQASITDFHLSKTSDRSLAPLALRSGADEWVDYDGTVYLSWTAFAVPYLQLQYTTVDATETEIPTYVEYIKPNKQNANDSNFDKDGTLSCVNFPVHNIKVGTGFTLRAYELPPGTLAPEGQPGGQKRLFEVASTTSVNVRPATPRIEAFTAVSNSERTRLLGTVEFKQLRKHFKLHIEHNNTPLHVPANKSQWEGNRFHFDFEQPGNYTTETIALVAESGPGSAPTDPTPAAHDILSSVTLAPNPDLPYELYWLPAHFDVQYQYAHRGPAATAPNISCGINGTWKEESTGREAVPVTSSGKITYPSVNSQVVPWGANAQLPSVRFGPQGMEVSCKATYQNPDIANYLRNKQFGRVFRCSVHTSWSSERYYHDIGCYLIFKDDSTVVYQMQYGIDGAWATHSYTGRLIKSDNQVWAIFDEKPEFIDNSQNCRVYDNYWRQNISGIFILPKLPAKSFLITRYGVENNWLWQDGRSPKFGDTSQGGAYSWHGEQAETRPVNGQDATTLFQRTELHGNVSGGGPFEDPISYGDRLKEVRVWESGQWIWSIQCVWVGTSGTVKTGPVHGRQNGYQHTITLGDDEEINVVKGGTNGYLANISFRTNKGKEYGPWGSKEGTPFIHQGVHLLGFLGRSGDYIDAVGFFLMQD